MGIASLDQKGTRTDTTDDSDELKLRNALTAALEAVFGKQEQDPRTHFHEQFRREADEYDRDFHKKYHDDLNTALIFAGLFSAVASAFIVEIQSQIRPDYGQLSFAALVILVNATSGTPNQTYVPTWSGPNPSAVQAQSTMFASLSSALLAAFLAMLGKQWLNLHVEGSFIDRNRHRELKMRGMITWKFKFVMECLPLVMQASLLLLGYGLARYFWDLSHTISSVIIGFTAFGLTFYLFIVFAATFSKACPFKTPVSIVLRLIIQRCRDYTVNAYNAALESSGSNSSNRGPATRQNQSSSSRLVSNINEHGGEIRADSSCITTMFKMTKASESVIAIMAYIPEIPWDKRIKSIPLIQVYQALRESLWRSDDGKVFLQPGARDRALSSAKALLHLYIQRRCLYGTDDTLKKQFDSINHKTQPLRYNDLDGDIQSTFYLVDWVFGAEPKPEIPWSKFKLTESQSHHCWLGHILQYRAWDSIRETKKLSEDARGFLDYSLACHTLPDRVVSDCLFIINMMAGGRPESQELLSKDRSHQILQLIDDIFDTLERTFNQNTPSGDIGSAVEALKRVVLLQQKRIRIRSYALFRTIMGLVKSDDRLWESAGLLMKGAYTSSEWVPPTGDPKDILDFLHFHISPSQRTTSRGDPIYYAFRSIVVGHSAEKRRALSGYSFDSTLFIDAIIQLLSNKDHADLQKMSLLVLPELDDILFTSEAAFNDPGRAEDFVTTWSTAILREETIPQIEVANVKVLLAIANLPCLRRYLLPEIWDLAYKFPIILYSDSPSMQRCIQNSDILPFIKGSTGVTGPLGWLGMLWMKYHSVSTEVRRQLEEETLAIGSGERYYDLNSYVSLFDAELKRLRGKIDGLEPLDRSVPGLRDDLDAMERANRRLVAIQGEGLAKIQEKRQPRVLPSEGRQNNTQSHTPSTNLSFPRALLNLTGRG